MSRTQRSFFSCTLLSLLFTQWASGLPGILTQMPGLCGHGPKLPGCVVQVCWMALQLPTTVLTHVTMPGLTRALLALGPAAETSTANNATSDGWDGTCLCPSDEW